MTEDPAETAAERADAAETDERSEVDDGQQSTSDDAASDAAAGGDAESDAASEDGGGTGAEAGSDDLAARVAACDEELGAEVADLQSRVESLESDLAAAEERNDDLTSQVKRAQADFQNYKKRAERRREQIKERATEDLVERLVKVRDNLLRALDQDENADIRGGVESTLSEFDRILEAENVSPIDPDPGEEVDPHRHEVMMRVESDQPEGTVADVFQQGYEMADQVIREAQVTVSDSDEE